MVTKALNFHLPDQLNATHPPEKGGLRRDHVKMMVLDRKTGALKHEQFFQLVNYLQPGDLIILNNSRTIPAILKGKLNSLDIEVRLARRISHDTWDALVVTDQKNLSGKIEFTPELSATVIRDHYNSPLKTIKFSQKGVALYNIIYTIGEPIRYEYIEQPWDLNAYQTVFASHPGSVEMPSAGRAFSWELLFDLMDRGIQIDYVQLHTGLSYFLDDRLNITPEDNFEEYHVSERTMKRIFETKKLGGRVIAVGTTVVRALESAARYGTLSGTTNLYINQDFPLTIANGIITGFHEPKASHLDMLSAFVTEQHLLNAYDEAIRASYLWHEFGDMNLIL